MKIHAFTKLKLPTTPGVYFWKKGKEILYIGKATNLRDRVRSYFAKDLIDTRGPGILDMVTQSTTVEFQETDSVLEAIILEANLIKKHQPKYNTKEKSDKSFYQVIITDESWPRVVMVRSRDLKIMELTGRISRIQFDGKIKYSFGPFPAGSTLRNALKIIRKIFPFFDQSSVKKDQQEFYRQLGLTPSGQREAYLSNIKNIALLFQGKKKNILQSLERDMKHASKELAFEQADILKKKIFALKHINDIALIKNDENDTDYQGMRIEAFDIAHHAGSHPVGVMTVVTDGRVDKSSYKKFIIRSGKGNDDYGNLKELLNRRLRHPEWLFPQLIVIDGGLGQYHIAQQVLAEHQLVIPVVSVIKDEKHKPKALHGDAVMIKKYKKEILLANSEAHRFAISFHKQVRTKKFLS